MADFDSARLSALVADMFRAFKGIPTDLLPFSEVKERLHLQQVVDRGIQEVPIDRIVGTVGREREFTRAFFPREESLRDRWEDMKDLVEGQSGYPSVELYYVNDIYFVVDGHHRISVARSLGTKTIEAHVKEFITLVPLDQDTTIEEVILKSGLVDFLNTTGLYAKSADDFVLTVPNGYERLLDHISVHRYYRGIELNHPVSWEEAVQSWCNCVYRPMLEIIRKHGVLADFPGYTETDLYLFTMDHLHHLRQRYADAAKPERAVRHFQLTARELHSIRRRIRSWWHKKDKEINAKTQTHEGANN